MNWDELNALIQRHGGVVSEPVVVDPEIDNPSVAGRETRPKIPNPNPARRYNLKDGKYFVARASGGGVETGQPDQGQEPVTFQIIDPGSAVQPLTPADRLPSAAQDLVRLDAQGKVIPPEDTTTRAAKLRDPSTGAVTDLPDAAAIKAGAPTTKTVNGITFQWNADSNNWDRTNLPVELAEPKAPGAPTTKTINGVTYQWNPGSSTWDKTDLPVEPPKPEAPQTKEVNGVTYQWDPASKSWSEAAGLPAGTKPATASTNTTAPFITFYDDQGNEVGRRENPNYQAPTPTQLTPDTVSTNIPLLKPDGSIDWVPNQNRVPVSAAMQELLAQVGVKVNAGEMSMADAKEMLTGTVNVMNARSAAANAQTAEQGVARAAAGDILTATQQGATTGASLINQRVQAAQGMLNTVLGMAGQGQRSGNMGGGLMSAPSGLGQQIVGGIQGWTEQLGGGPEVYATAANLVKRADPSNGANPQAQVAYGVLGQMLEKYQQLTGQQHPLVAEQARQQQQQQAGATVPAPTPALPTPAETFSSPPALAQPQYDPRFQPQMPQQEPGTLLPAGVAGTVPPGDPRFKGTFASPPVAPPPVTITIGG